MSKCHNPKLSTWKMNTGNNGTSWFAPWFLPRAPDLVAWQHDPQLLSHISVTENWYLNHLESGELLPSANQQALEYQTWVLHTCQCCHCFTFSQHARIAAENAGTFRKVWSTPRSNLLIRLEGASRALQVESHCLSSPANSPRPGQAPFHLWFRDPGSTFAHIMPLQDVRPSPISFFDPTSALTQPHSHTVGRFVKVPPSYWLNHLPFICSLQALVHFCIFRNNI